MATKTYLTKEEREKKRKQSAKERKQKEARIKEKTKSWFKGIPSKLQSLSEKQKAANKAQAERRKATSQRVKEERIAKIEKRKKSKVAKVDTKAKTTKAKTTKAKTTKPVVAKTATKGDGFGAKFKEARSNYLLGKGPKTFSWDGKEYHTRWKGESSEEQLAKRKKADVEDYQKFVSRKYGGGKV